MATKRKTTKTKTKKDLEAKIAELEGKLTQLSAQLGQKPAGQTAPPPPPPQQKPAEASKPAPQQKAPPPATIESIIQSVPTGNWNLQKAKTPGYVSENPRAWARRHPDVGQNVPTTSWTLQKAKVPGYTAPSNRYFATKQRLAFSKVETRFNGFGVQLGHGQGQAQGQAPPPPPPPSAAKGKLPKGTEQASYSGSSGGGNSRQSELEKYEQEYLARLDANQREAEELQAAAAELAAKKRAQSGSTSSSGGSTHGTLPKGF